MVDAFDKYNTWNTGTVIWIDGRIRSDDMMPMIKIGFREYGPGGEKSDSMGTYSGYSDQLDEYIGLYTLKLQKPYTQTKLKDIEGNSVTITPEMLKYFPGKNTTQSTTVSEWDKLQAQDKKDMELITEEGTVIVAV